MSFFFFPPPPPFFQRRERDLVGAQRKEAAGKNALTPSPPFFFRLSSSSSSSSSSSCQSTKTLSLPAAPISGTPSSRPRTLPGEFLRLLLFSYLAGSRELTMKEKAHFLLLRLKKKQQLLPLRRPRGLRQLHHRRRCDRRRGEEEGHGGCCPLAGAGQGSLCLKKKELSFCFRRPSLPPPPLPPSRSLPCFLPPKLQ